MNQNVAQFRIFKIALVSGCFLPLAAFSHHSFFGRFDSDAIMEIEGTVTDVIWRNPHAAVMLDVTDEDGAQVTWMIEASSPNQLRRSGIEPDSIKVGDFIKVAGRPPVTEEREIFATNVLIPDGTELFLERDAQPRWADEGIGDLSFQLLSEGDPSRPDLGLFRVWSYTYESPFLFPEVTDLAFKATDYPLTDAAVAALQSFDRARDNPTRNCTPKGMPTIMEQPYPMEIVRDGDNILLRIEEYDILRTIHMDRESVQQDQSSSPLGFSVGRWEGEDLLVTTTHLDWPYFNQLGIPQSRESVLLERFTLRPDGSRLDYELTVTDPATFSEPVHLERYFLYLPDQEVLPYECLDLD